MKSGLSTGLGGLAVLVGAIWIVQGLGWLKGSFMTGHLVWTWIGAVLLVAGVAVIVRSRRSRPTDRVADR